MSQRREEVALRRLEVAEALHHAHQLRQDGQPLGIVHRDVTPHNLMLSITGHVANWPCVRGGSGQLAEAMIRELERLGGEIVTGTQVHVLELVRARVVVLIGHCPLSPLADAAEEPVDLVGLGNRIVLHNGLSFK